MQLRFLNHPSFNVVAVGRSAERLKKLMALDGATDSLTVASMDVRDVEQVKTVLSSLPKIDLLVANAGVCRRTPIDGADADAVWNDVIDTNLNGVWRTFRAAVPRLGAGGAAVVVSSGLGKLGRGGYGAYAASKHAVLGLVKCLSKELAPMGIRVNAVCPGWVDTEMAAADLDIDAADTGRAAESLRKEAEAGIPLGRFVTADETAALICWLLSDEAGAITGQSYNISGGEFTC